LQRGGKTYNDQVSNEQVKKKIVTENASNSGTSGEKKFQAKRISDEQQIAKTFHDFEHRSVK
jgi:hypothetical protein